MRNQIAVIVTSLLTVTGAGVPIATADADRSAPIVANVSISSTVLDVTEAAQRLTISFEASDENRVRPGLIALQMPNYSGTVSTAYPRLIDGTDTHGRWEWSVVVPRDAYPGDWGLWVTPVADGLGNYTQLAALLPGRVEVINNDRTPTDTEVPELAGLEYSTEIVDVSDAPQEITVRMRLKDLSGTTTPWITVIHSQDGLDRMSGSAVRLVEGDITDGWWETTIAVGQRERVGYWFVDLCAPDDVVGNQGYCFGWDTHGLNRSFVVVDRQRATVPAAPTSVYASPSGTSATVSWSPGGDGDWPISRYLVTANPGGHTVETSAEDWSAEFHNLTVGTPYTFTVQAENGIGLGPIATSEAVVPLVVPGPPTDVRAEAGPSSVVVTWSPPEFDGGQISNYLVRASGANDVIVGADVRSATLSNLPIGAAVAPSVTAINGAGWSSPADANAAATPFDEVTRLAGGNRFETAARVAAETTGPTPLVYIASGASFPDALAGAALAGSTGAPILLATRDRVPAATLDALSQLKPERIVLLGGLPTLSEDVARTLRAIAPTSRISGSDRYATAALIADGFDAPEVVYVASGSSFPDALAGAALAGSQDAPVLLTTPRTLRDSTRTAIETLDPDRIVILGGEPSVGAAVLESLNELAPTERIAGRNRFETAELVAAEFDAPHAVFLASGLTFPDALSGAALAGASASPILLTTRDSLPNAAASALQRATPDRAYILGDVNAVGSSVEQSVRSALRAD